MSHSKPRLWYCWDLMRWMAVMPRMNYRLQCKAQIIANGMNRRIRMQRHGVQA